MDKFKQLESFVAVATLGSLSAAARLEGIAPAMMGRRINALESRLGVKLLVRSTRRLSLTMEGEALLDNAQRILHDLTEVESRISQDSSKPSGHLRISAPAGFGRRHVAPLLPGFLRTYPKVTVLLDLSDRLVDLIEERYDCAIRIGDLDDSQHIGVRLADNRRVIIAAPSYLAKFGRPNTPDDLSQHNCLSFGAQGNQSKGWLLKQDGHVRAYRVKGSLSCSDGSVLHDWALAGCGLAWRSLWEVGDDLKAGRLVTVLDEYAAPPNGIFAILTERKHLPPRVRVFVDLLKSTYAPELYWEKH
ncbi:MAG: LysR family transcriptional regulator [Burkholderiaceae bacterium]|nr:MAG: LysR family transcriptional regulator [Burkholderiaceae bacterium]TAM02801.1 MAG: LysR family transcriptional regulator [Pusillimonas sp.]